jgi:hypothetical protein
MSATMPIAPPPPPSSASAGSAALRLVPSTAVASPTLLFSTEGLPLPSVFLAVARTSARGVRAVACGNESGRRRVGQRDGERRRGGEDAADVGVERERRRAPESSFCRASTQSDTAGWGGAGGDVSEACHAYLAGGADADGAQRARHHGHRVRFTRRVTSYAAPR